MDHSQPQLHQSVQEVLDKWPQAADAFRAFRTACSGCYLARFCTLEDVVTTSKLELDLFCEKLGETIQYPNQRRNK